MQPDRGVIRPLIKLTSIADGTLNAFDNIVDGAQALAMPNLRLGVTGLSRAGKTVFITALVHNLVHGGRLPLFQIAAEGRIARAFLQPQPDDTVPRFDYEAHVNTLLDERIWPQSTRQVSELRLTVEYESATFMKIMLGRGTLNLDIVDYPGEWLLDLPLLNKNFRTWSREALALASEPARKGLAAPWLDALAKTDPQTEADETQARDLAARFTAYLGACRDDDYALSLLPPGRFLMPGDMEGSPALTFCPLDLADGTSAKRGSLAAMMERRFEAYKKHVVRPFFREHFARLDRQIVLVDALSALNAGPAAVRDLEAALAGILSCFRPGRNSWLSHILVHRIDRILFAATKADHLHHTDHDRLEAILAKLVEKAVARAEFAGAEVEVSALAAIRATREAQVREAGVTLPTILGTPLPGERLEAETYDGNSEIALFPGDLPDDPAAIYEPAQGPAPDLRFIRFRPPKLERTAEGLTLSLPHIRLDRALQFLVGDKLA
ncbi:YcjX family protein [Breoghania sp.]|uniref:YcjX family protein n=1 Tax=Breoghania sp. TaxID=2065378 RepID=UPI00262BEF4A|nr:YcjX family protein [Breoghania sp.]MDJ0932120.1 YcjX family protein [Breoghania sp.]